LLTPHCPLPPAAIPGGAARAAASRSLGSLVLARRRWRACGARLDACGFLRAAPRHATPADKRSCLAARNGASLLPATHSCEQDGLVYRVRFLVPFCLSCRSVATAPSSYLRRTAGTIMVYTIAGLSSLHGSSFQAFAGWVVERHFYATFRSFTISPFYCPLTFAYCMQRSAAFCLLMPLRHAVMLPTFFTIIQTFLPILPSLQQRLHRGRAGRARVWCGCAGGQQRVQAAVPAHAHFCLPSSSTGSFPSPFLVACSTYCSMRVCGGGRDSAGC